MVANPVKRRDLLQKVTAYSSNVRGGSAYWANVSKKLSNIVENSPAPTIFFTFSFPDIYTRDISDLIFDNSPFPYCNFNMFR